ncbi:hypothetical protein JOQ06_001196 [Pogonophryne albipinna]|uniref:Cadherin domain-containing protein n=1 Tax=Pogonophryne albipinna TaxID=1090488 RepID=A0AAD6B6K5_9TELE|nr:hypothetical protein JOQ06_001196 [Pogonophryne albipinna]
MDREIKGEYQVLLQAKDMGGLLGGLASTTTINVTLGDVNDNPPRFAKSIFHLQVPESASMGSAVGGIRAYDPDAGANAEVDYTIVPGEEGNMFDIISSGQSQEGIVVLKKDMCGSWDIILCNAFLTHVHPSTSKSWTKEADHKGEKKKRNRCPHRHSYEKSTQG